MQESGEMYLETLLILSEQSDDVHAVDLAHYLGYSKPSVSRALGILQKEGYIDVAKDGKLSFTDAGRQYAEHVYERHRVLTDFFVSLGVPSDIAESDACKVEHVISNELYSTIKRITEENNNRE